MVVFGQLKSTMPEEGADLNAFAEKYLQVAFNNLEVSALQKTKVQN